MTAFCDSPKTTRYLWQNRKTKSELLCLELLTNTSLVFSQPHLPAVTLKPAEQPDVQTTAGFTTANSLGKIAQLQNRVLFDLRLWTGPQSVFLIVFVLFSFLSSLCTMCKQCSFLANSLNNCVNCVFPTVNIIKSDSTCFSQQNFIYFFEKKTSPRKFSATEGKLQASICTNKSLQLQPPPAK